MADTYEKDLAQKSTLTTSDYIRVVGSDNVSYKQLVSAVMTAMGLDAIETPATNVANVDTAISTGFYSYAGTATGTKPTSSGGDLIVIAHSATYSVQVAITYSATGTNYIYKRVIVSGTPTEWQLQPTRAEVDALASDSGWLELTTNVKYRKVGKICYVNIDGYTTTQTSGAETIGTLPTGYRPVGGINVQWCARKGTSTLAAGWVTAEGAIKYAATSASGTLAGFISFPVG